MHESNKQPKKVDSSATIPGRQKQPAAGFVELPGLDPRTGRPATFKIAKALVDKIMAHDADKAGNMWHLPRTVATPSRAWRGLRDDMPDGLAMMTRPVEIFYGVGKNEFTRAPPGMAFFAYCSGSLIIHDWGWVDFLRELRGAKTTFTSTSDAENLYGLRSFGSELALSATSRA